MQMLKALKALFSRMCLFIALTVTSVGLIRSQENQPIGEGKETEQQLITQWMNVYDEIVSGLLITSEGVEQNFEMTTLLTIQNPLMSDRHGRVYLWSKQGRPQLVASIMSSVDVNLAEFRNVNYEFHSLSAKPVAVARESVEFWTSDQPGIDWIKLEGSGAPSTSRTRRMTEMRQIARRFTARRKDNEFRLMPQPLFRYPESTSPAADGAIFSYAMTTDPFVYLLVEARDDGWFVAFARASRNGLSVTLDDKPFWAVEQLKNRNPIQKGAFYLIWYGERRLANDPQTTIFTAWDK